MRKIVVTTEGYGSRNDPCATRQHHVALHGGLRVARVWLRVIGISAEVTRESGYTAEQKGSTGFYGFLC